MEKLNKLKNILKPCVKYLLPIYIVLNILYVIIGSYFYEIKELKYYTYSRGYISFLLLNVVVLIFLLVRKIKTNKKLDLNIMDIFLLFMILFSFISVIFAKKVDVALYGMPGRYEGLYQICYYFSVFMLTTYLDKKHKPFITYILVFSAALEAVYAYFQIMNVGNIARTWHDGRIWATGFTMNPNFFGSLMVLGLSSAIGLFIDNKKPDYRIFLGSLILILMTGLLISNTMSAVVGLFVVLIYTLIYIVIKKKIIPFIIVLVLLILPTVFIVSINKTTLIKDTIKTSKETQEIMKGHIDGEYGTKRMFIWTKTLEIVPKNLLHGVGIDNFYYAFGNAPIAKGRWFFDKAHNEYLQVLITEGIFSLISYLAFFAIIVIRAIKENYKHSQIYLILPVLGYLAQAFFNISVIEVAPLFYIFLGLAVTRNLGGKQNEKSKRSNTST